MSVIIKPTEGAPNLDLLPGGDALVGVDGNAYSVMAAVSRFLKRAGASREYVDAYMAEAMSADYDHLLATSVAYLSPEWESNYTEDEDDEDEEFTFGDAMALRFG